MKPPAPGPVSGDSAANDISTAATAASTALPPLRSTAAPASAVIGCPAATTPLMLPTLSAPRSAGQFGAALLPVVRPRDRGARELERGGRHLAVGAGVEVGSGAA